MREITDGSKNTQLINSGNLYIVKFPSIRLHSLIIVVSLILVATSFTFSSFISDQYSKTAKETMRQNSLVMAKNLAISSAHHLVVGDYASMELVLLQFAVLPRILEIQAIDNNGGILSDIKHRPGEDPIALVSIANSMDPSTLDQEVIINEQQMIIIQPVEAGDLLGWLKITISLEEIRSDEQAIWKNTIIVGVFWIIISVVLLSLILHRPIRSIKQLTDFARSLDELKGNEIPVDSTFQEIKDLGKSLNYASKKIYESERAIKNSLNEKNVLLKEIHHRVKNNMAVISSLLSLQLKYVDDEKYIEMFEESKSRIKSMALVHEKLYQTDNFADIDMQDYVISLTKTVRNTFGSGKEFSVIADIDKINIDIDILIPCGLIINEILTNAFKHAFSEHTNPEIKVVMKWVEGNNISLKISDNGKGLPEGFDISHSTGLGLMLVNTLTSQIDGTLSVKSEKGTEFKIVFPGKLESARHNLDI